MGPLKTLEVEGGPIPYRIKRSLRRRKTYQVSIVEGVVMLAVPHTTTNQQAEDMIRQKAGWILPRLAAAASRQEAAPRLVTGEKLPYLGRQVTLQVQAAATGSGNPAVAWAPGRLKISVPVGPDGPDAASQQEQVAQALAAWYGAQTRAQVEALLARWVPAMGCQTSPPFHIRNQRRRWGSCSAAGVLRFNWRLAMLSPDLVEYVVVHELCHLTHLNHSPNFWNLVAHHLPGVTALRKELKHQERGLPAL